MLALGHHVALLELCAALGGEQSRCVPLSPVGCAVELADVAAAQARHLARLGDAGEAVVEPEEVDLVPGRDERRAQRIDSLLARAPLPRARLRGR